MWPLIVMLLGLVVAAWGLALFVRHQARKERERKTH